MLGKNEIHPFLYLYLLVTTALWLAGAGVAFVYEFINGDVFSLINPRQSLGDYLHTPGVLVGGLALHTAFAAYIVRRNSSYVAIILFFALFALLESNSIGISCFDAHHEPSLPIIVLHAILVVAMPLSVLAGSMAFKTANTLAVGEALKPYALRYYLIPTLLFVAVVAAVNLRNRPMLGSEPIEQGVATLLFVCCYMEAVARSYFRHIYPYSANRNAMPIVTSEKRDLWLSALLAMVFAVSVVIWLNYGDFSVPYTFRDNPESYNHNYLVMLTLVAPALVLAYYHYVKRSVWAGFGLLFMVAHTAWLLREERFSPANASGEFLAIAFMLVWFGLLLSIRQYWRIKLFHSYSMQVPALNMPLYMLSRIAMLAVLVTLGMLMPLKAAIDLSRTFAFLGWFL